MLLPILVLLSNSIRYVNLKLPNKDMLEGRTVEVDYLIRTCLRVELWKWIT